MKNAMKTKLYLILSGVVLALVGLYIAGSTTDYFAVMMATEATPSVNLSSDLRGMGGMLLIMGAYVLVGAFRQQEQRSALLVATLVFAAFVVFRSLGMVIDGIPGTAVVGAYAIEALMLVMGAALLKRQPANNDSSTPALIAG